MSTVPEKFYYGFQEKRCGPDVEALKEQPFPKQALKLEGNEYQRYPAGTPQRIPRFFTFSRRAADAWVRGTEWAPAMIDGDDNGSEC